MGWFNNQSNKSMRESIPSLPELPGLPELPELPELPTFSDTRNSRRLDDQLYPLPSFPSNVLGNKFSQNAIKEAVSGEKRDEEEEADELSPMRKKVQMKRPSSIFTKEIKDTDDDFVETISRMRKAEPIFIRLDKFEESLKVFEKTKEKILEIEKTLQEIKTIKEAEERELEAWENEIQKIKSQVEKVDKDIFSKVA